MKSRGGLKMFKPMILSNENKVLQIPIENLIPFHNHKFRLYEGEQFLDMVGSIRENGVITPIIVRPLAETPGEYEILAGHNRTNAARSAGLSAVPAIVKENLTDEEAEIYVVETNLIQRGFSDLRISEQAAVVAMRYSSIFSAEKVQAVRDELQALETGEKYKDYSKFAVVGEEYNLGRSSVVRLLRVDKLIDTLKSFVDDGSLNIRAAVELSYISEENQNHVSALMVKNDEVIPVSAKLAKQIRFGCNEQNFKLKDLKHLLYDKPEKEEKPRKIPLPKQVCEKYFTDDYSNDEIAEIIEEALELYFERN
jgi:ParB family chromosome partitioning protein